MLRRINRSVLVFFTVASVAGCDTGGPDTGSLPDIPFDRLVRSHAAASGNGVAWRTWSPAVCDEASARNVPLLLAVTPVWSTRARELERGFQNPDIAAFINRWFIPVRIDPLSMPLPLKRCGMSGYRGLAAVTADGEFLGDAGWPAPAVMEKKLAVLADAAPEELPAAPEEHIDAVLAAYHASVAGAFNPRTGTFDVPDGLLPAVLTNLVRHLYATRDSETADRLHAALAAVTASRYDSADGGFAAAAGVADKPLAASLGFAKVFLRAYQATGRRGYAEIALAAGAYIDSVLFLPDAGRYAGGIVAGTGKPDTLYRNAASAAAAALLAEITVAAGDGAVAPRHRAVLDAVLAEGRHGRSGLFFRTGRKHPPFYLQDQAVICRSCLAMYELTGDNRYAAAARMLADRVLGRFRTSSDDRFTGAVTVHGPARFPADAESAALMLEVLSRLDFLFEDGRYNRLYAELTPLVRGCAARAGLRGAGLMTALDEPFAPLVEIFVVGEPDHEMTGRMLAVVKRRYLPFARIKTYEPDRGGHRRGALIFPFFYAPVGYAALHGRLYGAYFDPAGLESTLIENGY